MRQPFRIEPVLPVASMKTYGIVAPLATHYRAATCAEVECEAYTHGWLTAVNEVDDLGARQAHHIRRVAGRRFTETRRPDGCTEFRFEAGQKCFRAHQVPLEREPLYVVRGGDWRGNPRAESRQHARPADWVDDFAEHQDRLATRLQQG